MRKIITIIIMYFIICVNVVYACTPSSWAQEEVAELKSTGYFDITQFCEYQEPITREKFIYFVARLFEIMSGNEIHVDSSITFNDTSDIWVIKGATVGITSGTGNGNFEPNSLLTREQFATMVIRTLNLGKVPLTKPNLYKFNDDNEISLWAKESIYLAKENGIISGVGNEKVAPKLNTTVEQCIIIINRTLKNNKDNIFTYNGIDNTIPYKTKFVQKNHTNASYYGEINNEVYNGYGRLTFNNGAIYAGEWVDGKLNGQGTSILSNGDVYNGEFKDGKCDGYGKLVLYSGLTYIGEFKDNLYNGQGIYFGNGAEYKGEFVNGKIKYGTFTSSEAKYVGDFKNYAPSGNGIMTFKFGEYYGEFEDGHMVEGTFVFNNGDVYIGEFKDNLYNGQGELTYANGEKYVGEFKDNSFNGYGTYTKNDGTSVTGKWENNQFKE